MTPQQPTDMLQMLQAIFGQQQQQPGMNIGDLAAIFNAPPPPTRHIGMGGEDITGQKGPYDSGGIDWLKAHNNGTNGITAIDPAARANTLIAMGNAGVAAPRPNIGHLLPTYSPAPVELSTANADQLSAYEGIAGQPKGSLPLGTKITPYGTIGGGLLPLLQQHIQKQARRRGLFGF